MAREWGASTYDRIADPMTRWGAAVLERADLAGDERVLDAGCGSGRVTELLLEALPRGSIIAIDSSTAMIEEARTRLAGSSDRVELVVADLVQPLPLREPVDAVFSTATFHWIRDHDSVFRNLALVLKPRGRLVAQCGGRGNIARLIAVVRELGLDWDDGPTYFAGPEETRERLAAAGFVDIEC